MSRAARENLELRPLGIQTGTLSNHDGSAQFSFGNVTALSAISGPSEVRIRDELTDRSTLEINYTPLQGVPGITALTFSNALIQVFSHVLLLHLYPRSLIQINLQTYTSPPTYIAQPLLHKNQKLRQLKVSLPHPDAIISVSLQAAHINAITCSCLDASVHVKSLVASASAVIVRRGVRKNFMKGWKAGETVPSESAEGKEGDEFEVLLDPSPYEESLSKSQHVFAFAFTRVVETDTYESSLVYNESRGAHSGRDYLDVMKLCREASKEILKSIRASASQQL
ncbi:hypothetical protein CBS101457_006373 [Exobasidium rhododendri]|nr:hypothetical protein CBS101457_006373 [Exobasidium rhododendri]